jgi:hypothetical protein
MAQATTTPATATPPTATGGGSGAGGYKPTSGSAKANESTRHPAHTYAGIGDPEAYRAYVARLARHALTGAGGAMEAVGTLKAELRRNDEYPWAAKQRALWILRRAHRKYAAAERAAAKAAVRMANARAKADEMLVEAAAKKKTRRKAGMYHAGNGRK